MEEIAATIMESIKKKVNPLNMTLKETKKSIPEMTAVIKPVRSNTRNNELPSTILLVI